MSSLPDPARRRFRVPEVVQSSSMDCGPAALKSVFEGFGIPISYGRLREACQTDVDGTSIDTLEEIANQLGLHAEQIVVPPDHLLLPEAHALPAILVVRHAEGYPHFIVIWRAGAGLVQIMDPAEGRRWLLASRLLRDVYQHVMPVPAAAWRTWAASPEALASLKRRLRSLALPAEVLEDLTARALSDPGWRAMAALDAATRAVHALVRSGGLHRGGEAAKTLRSLFEDSRRADAIALAAVPVAYWSVSTAPSSDEGEERLLLRGAVLVRIRRVAATATSGLEPLADATPPSPELAAARQEAPGRPGHELLRLLAKDGLLTPGFVGAALFIAAAAVVVEALLFRGLLELAPLLGLSGQRMGALGALVGFLLLSLLLELPIAIGQLRMGRRLEARLRVAFQEKIPRLSDRYFRSRLTSDLAERFHSLHILRLLPSLGGELVRNGFELLLTLMGILWLDPRCAVPGALAAALALALPLAFQPLLGERELRARTHAGALGRFTLDALLGLSAVRAHGAQRSFRRQHEGLLVEWARARLRLQRAIALVQALQAVVGCGLAAWLLLSHLARGGEIGTVLLLVYWALKLPALGESLAQGAWQYPTYSNVMLRLLDPLGSPEDAPETNEGEGAPGLEELPGMKISARSIRVRAGGHAILQDLDLEIEAGRHVAVVGPSGAGKSSLLGLLLGWHRPAAGTLLVDGKALQGDRLEWLRKRTAWVDPAVQLWNRAFLDNLRYGKPAGIALPLAAVIDQAELRPLLDTLPEGYQTILGEGGGLVSGGEGQRVRLGRALLQPGTRLVLLDEPFRGLDRSQRSRLLERSREVWRGATLLCVTHDLSETRAFDRVLVLEAGRIVEDGSPEELESRPGSRYRLMLEAEEATRKLWADAAWRRMHLQDGRLQDAEPRAGG